MLYYLKQLLPLTYRSYYDDGCEERFAVWRQWFGHVWDVDEVAIKRVPQKELVLRLADG